MKIAVIGAGISGLGSAYLLSQKHEVDLYEKENRLGGHARTKQLSHGKDKFGVDTGFLVFNHTTYPLMTKLFETLGVKTEKSDMSFGFWDEESNLAYNCKSLGGMFFQKKSLFNPKHYGMIADILKFNKQSNHDLKTQSENLEKTLGDYLAPYGDAFKERYILPMGAAIWSTPRQKIDDFPARTFLQFFQNHGLLGIDTQHQWYTVSNGSVNYVNKVAQKISGEILLDAKIKTVKRFEKSVELHFEDETVKTYDKVVFALHAPDALKMMENISPQEQEILGAFAYKPNIATLHHDENALYPNPKVYAAWNYKRSKFSPDVSLSYWLNTLQNLKTSRNYFVSLNATTPLKHVIERIEFEHPLFDREAIEAQTRHDEINGKNNSYFAGAYWRYGFHEDGLYSANRVAKDFDCAFEATP